MKHLDQENKGLETQLTAAQNDLDDEKKTLDEKSTFLHFTQEQLNVEIENLTCAKEKMTMEIDNLKALLQTKEQERKSEKDKVKTRMVTIITCGRVVRDCIWGKKYNASKRS